MAAHLHRPQPAQDPAASTRLEIADRAYIRERGRVVLEGNREEILHDELTAKAYLGL
jgi:branched-chain amino acid transport system ATP-binding protein